MAEGAEKVSTLCTSVFTVTYMWEEEVAEQHWLFLLEPFLWEKLTDMKRDM